ncbi:MAG TPA: hypothetical protein VH143_34275 [Kofleriaceae bacterium]|nr:hypothetical protein [Kofleriaceae bacterium]
MRNALLALLVACGGGHGAQPDAAAVADAMPDAIAPDAATRLRLANGGVQLLVTGSATGFQITPADLATDSDVIEIHQEYYGVPWDEFAAGLPPPAAWQATMDAIAASAHATGKPIFLSVSMLDGTRKTLAPKPGNVANWAASCYDFASDGSAATYEHAYDAYVAWMIDEFQPTWLNFAIEVNLFFESCPSAASGLVTAANAAYAAIKAKQPSLIAFPSFEIDHLYGVATGSCAGGDQAACFDANYAVIAPMMRDRFAMSSYPIQLGGMSVAQLPADWFTRGAARGGERAVISETGTNDTPLAIDDPVNGCFTAVPGSDGDASAYLARVLDDGAAAKMDFVNWWSDRDLVDAQLMTSCPCTFDANWCAVDALFRGSDVATEDAGELALKAFGTMGLRDYAGNPKSFYSIWQAAR